MKPSTFASWSLSATVSKYIVPAIILLHLGITVTLSNMQNVWPDEAFSLHTTEYSISISQTISRAINFEQQAPGYFVLLLWLMIECL